MTFYKFHFSSTEVNPSYLNSSEIGTLGLKHNLIWPSVINSDTTEFFVLILTLFFLLVKVLKEIFSHLPVFWFAKIS